MKRRKERAALPQQSPRAADNRLLLVVVGAGALLSFLWYYKAIGYWSW